MFNFLKIILILLFVFLHTPSTIFAETVTVKCHIDENKSYSFMIDKEKKEIYWLDENNQKLILIIYPDTNKGASLLIMAGTSSEKEKHTFVLDVKKSMLSITTNLGFNKAAQCGNKSIFEFKEEYN